MQRWGVRQCVVLTMRPTMTMWLSCPVTIGAASPHQHSAWWRRKQTEGGDHGLASLTCHTTATTISTTQREGEPHQDCSASGGEGIELCVKGVWATKMSRESTA